MVQTGIGINNAEAALKYILQGYRPDIVLSLGFGGALYSGAEIGDLVWASKVFMVNNGIAETIELPESGETASRMSGRITIREGTILTLDRRMKKAEIGNELYKGLPFPVCDMETFAIAKGAIERGLPFRAVRSITDRAEEEIPQELFEVVDESGTYRLSRSLSVLLRKPHLIPQSMKLGMNSKTASRRLWLSVKSFIETL